MKKSSDAYNEKGFYIFGRLQFLFFSDAKIENISLNKF